MDSMDKSAAILGGKHHFALILDKYAVHFHD